MKQPELINRGESMKTTRSRRRATRRKGQSLVEFALGGLLLAMFMAAALDFGRAYYTYIVVQNMAGEGAAYLSQFPDRDYTQAHTTDQTYQERARNVARQAGVVIDQQNINLANNDVTTNVAAASRCAGTAFTVTVHYHINDLFLPALIGVNSLTLGADAPSTFTTSSGSSCS
jgi:Flp pilus assembly protein TadG